MNRSITYVELALHKEKDHWLLIDGIVYEHGLKMIGNLIQVKIILIV